MCNLCSLTNDLILLFLKITRNYGYFYQNAEQHETGRDESHRDTR
jgi:hypothetical protein